MRDCEANARVDAAADGAAGEAARGCAPAGDDGMAFSATLPTRGLPRFTPRELLTALNRILRSTGTSATLVPELTRDEQSPGNTRVWHRPQTPPRIGVDVAGIAVVVEGQDRPGFDARALEALHFRSWPAGMREIGRARAHVRVTEAGPGTGPDLDHNHDRAAALTAVAAGIAALVTPVGVVWDNSGVALPPGGLDEAMESLAAAAAPVGFWIAAAESWSGGVETRGLYPLLGAEIKVAVPRLSHDALGNVALTLAAEILEDGRPPAEGTEVEYGRSGAMRVSYRGPESEGAPPAVVLERIRPVEVPLRAGAA